jgi:hypothetical protein
VLDSVGGTPMVGAVSPTATMVRTKIPFGQQSRGDGGRSNSADNRKSVENGADYKASYPQYCEGPVIEDAHLADCRLRRRAGRDVSSR